jgi:hypothetical protein
MKVLRIRLQRRINHRRERGVDLIGGSNRHRPKLDRRTPTTASTASMTNFVLSLARRDSAQARSGE